MIGISDPFIGQVLQPALSRDRIFLHVRREDQLIAISEALIATHQNRFTLICFPAECELFPPLMATRHVGYEWTRVKIRTLRSGEYGKYRILTVEVEENPPLTPLEKGGETGLQFWS